MRREGMTLSLQFLSYLMESGKVIHPESCRELCCFEKARKAIETACFGFPLPPQPLHQHRASSSAQSLTQGCSCTALMEVFKCKHAA